MKISAPTNREKQKWHPQNVAWIIAISFAALIALYEAKRVAGLRQHLAAIGDQQFTTKQSEQAKRVRDDIRQKLEIAQRENTQLIQQAADVNRLRTETNGWRTITQELARLKANQKSDPIVSEAVAWQERIQKLKQRFEENPAAKIPELQLISEQDWFEAARSPLNTDEDYRRAMSRLRYTAETKFEQMLQPALRKYFNSHGEKFPADLSELQPYFESPVDEAMLQRYTIIPADNFTGLRMGGNQIVTQKAPVDKELDSRMGIGPNGYGCAGPEGWDESYGKIMKTLDPVMKAYAADHGSKQPTDPSELVPYLKTPEQRTAYESALKMIEKSKKTEK